MSDCQGRVRTDRLECYGWTGVSKDLLNVVGQVISLLKNQALCKLFVVYGLTSIYYIIDIFVLHFNFKSFIATIVTR
mgnify:CR=1 FL=1